jgi:peptidyl-prolyl cis-trans isomerase D
MLLNQQRFAWVGTSFVLPEELNKFLTLYYEKRSYSYLQLPVEVFMQQVAVNDAAIQDYYKQNTAKFLNPERVSVDYILLSKKDLRKDVQVSDVKIKQYYAENFNESKKSLSEMQESIREQLLNEKVELEYSRLLEQLTDLSYQESESLQNVAKVMKLELNHSDLFSREGGATDITKNPAILRVAFSHDVLKFGNNSAPIAFGDDGVVVLRINQHLRSAPKKLEEVKEEIIKQLQHIKAVELAHQVGENILHGNDDADVLRKYSLVWKQISKAKRDSDEPSTTINELVFDMTRKHPRKGHTLTNGDYVVLQLNDIIPGDLKHIDKELKASIAQQMEANIGLLDYDLYAHNLMSVSKIVKQKF